MRVFKRKAMFTLIGSVVVCALSINSALADHDELTDPKLILGKQLFEQTAGGTGCAICHGMDGKSGIAPPNAGANETKLRSSLGAVATMQYIKLNRGEIKALSSYLDFLGQQSVASQDTENNDG